MKVCLRVYHCSRDPYIVSIYFVAVEVVEEAEVYSGILQRPLPPTICTPPHPAASIHAHHTSGVELLAIIFFSVFFFLNTSIIAA